MYLNPDPDLVARIDAGEWPESCEPEPVLAHEPVRNDDAD